MRQEQVKTGHRKIRARTRRERDEVLPLDPRDPDIVRAKRARRGQADDG
jgi:hypothetical protein